VTGAHSGVIEVDQKQHASGIQPRIGNLVLCVSRQRGDFLRMDSEGTIVVRLLASGQRHNLDMFGPRVHRQANVFILATEPLFRRVSPASSISSKKLGNTRDGSRAFRSSRVIASSSAH
jgi:hypothetical protein